MGFGFNLFVIFILLPVTGILFIIWILSKKKYSRENTRFYLAWDFWTYITFWDNTMVNSKNRVRQRRLLRRICN